MELDMFGDPKKKCYIKDCNEGAVLYENNHYYCPDHYAEKVLQIPLSEIGKGGEKDED
tara:strand:- start:2366 stop:2539 length:174 start_codon:yes stop_codon:yes gene_type:complete